MQVTGQAISKLEQQIGQLATVVGEREKGKFPSQPLPNPKGQFQISEPSSSLNSHEQVQSIATLRSGKQVDNKVQMPNLDEDAPINKSKDEEVPTPLDNHSSSAPKIQTHPVTNQLVRNYVTKAPFPQRLVNPKKGAQFGEILEVFKRVNINIPFLDAIQQVPSYTKFLKDLCTLKRKTNVPKKAFLTEQVSSIIHRKSPVKYKDPGNPTISCTIGENHFKRALLDLGASVNLLPYYVYVQMGLGGMKPTRVVLQLADRSMKYPRGIVEDVLVQVDKFYFVVDFIILDTQPISNLSDEIPFILGRPFLATCDANSRSGMMTISFGNMTLDLNIFSISKQPLENDEVGEVNLIDNLVTDTFHQSSIKDPLEACLVHFGADFDFDKSIEEVNALLDSVPLIDSANWKSKVEPLPFSSSPPIPSIVKPLKLDLKQLPNTLKYAFLGPSESLPVIIASDLSSTQEEKLLQILKEHKEAIGWSIADIKGISPSVVMHRIHLEDNAKTSCEAQRRLNPAMKEVVRAEVLKLLDVGVIYPISDSQWVRPVQVVPKKSGITVVKNDDNELVPTRIQTSWRVCIDYRKLNAVMRKDHFPFLSLIKCWKENSGDYKAAIRPGQAGRGRIRFDLVCKSGEALFLGSVCLTSCGGDGQSSEESHHGGGALETTAEVLEGGAASGETSGSG
uniref:uncharacterized protein LOC105350087 n=1 Tax=Fragaria vesca subsp. vesca TaxID=101020 RepID=UPI0005C90ED9|nr:PREDICTED: uncharacterized protein LOC105350087 [Fragaria vesca subsp. vesca]